MNTPPKRAITFLRWFCREDYIEEIEGDLIEVFLKESQVSPRLARWNFTWRVMKTFRPEFMRSFKSSQPNSTGMFRSYFTIGWRNLLSQRLYSAINISSLTIGLTCFILLLLYVQHELSFDRFYSHSDRIYRLYQHQEGNVYMGTENFGVTPSRLASIMRDEFAEVESATAINGERALLSYNDNNFVESGILADSHLLEVLPFSLRKGNPKSALDDPKSILVTESLAKKLFGDAEPIGKLVGYRDDGDLIVTGVLADLPSNSSFDFSYVARIENNSYFVDEVSKGKWNGNSVETFYVVREGSSPTDVEINFPKVIATNRDPVAYKGYPFKDTYISLPIADWHLTTNINENIGVKKGNMTYLYLFSIVAVVVLLLACVNYMNLAIARSIKRAREVGLRKVVGALKRQLIVQFLGESVFIALVSLVLAVCFTILLLPIANYLLNTKIELNALQNSTLLLVLFVTIVVVGVFSGSYPAVVMSALKPIDVLRGKMTGKIAGFALQRVLVVVQYAASVVMLIGSLVIFRQIEFIRDKELGYDKFNVVTMPVKDDALVDKYETLENEWARYPGVISSVMTTTLPTRVTSSTIWKDEDGSGPEDDVAIYQMSLAGDFLKTFGIELVAGRTFTDGDIDKSYYILNETAARAMGWTPQDAIGKEVLDNNRMNTIVGVVRDFHMHSMHLAIQPLVIRPASHHMNYISVRVQPDRLNETIIALEQSINRISKYPFDYEMLDDNFDKLYESENKLGEIFGMFTVLSILVASLGLFGLAAFTSNQRTKEVGIRKVLGASVQNITLLLSRDFMKLVAIAFIISAPVAWYLASNWLQEFAYRTNIDWTSFAIAALLMLIVTNVAVAYQSIKAATANPVVSLKQD